MHPEIMDEKKSALNVIKRIQGAKRKPQNEYKINVKRIKVCRKHEAVLTVLEQDSLCCVIYIYKVFSFCVYSML